MLSNVAYIFLYLTYNIALHVPCHTMYRRILVGLAAGKTLTGKTVQRQYETQDIIFIYKTEINTTICGYQVLSLSLIHI